MRFWKQNSVFIGLCLILIIVLGTALICVPTAELHLLLCNHHTPIGDIFFRYYTIIGEWVPYCVCVLLFFYKAGWAVFTLSGTLLAGLTTQIIKRIANTPRPLTYFATYYPDIELPLADGVEMSRYFSFPSGHTTTFFALFFALCIITTNFIHTRLSLSQKENRPKSRTYLFVNSTIWQIIYFGLATLGGYSRIYLSQHFAADILGGICVGILITTLLYFLLERWQKQKWWSWNFFAKKSS